MENREQKGINRILAAVTVGQLQLRILFEKTSLDFKISCYHMGRELKDGRGMGVLSIVLRFLWHPVTIVTILGTLLFIAGTASGIYFHSNPGLITAVGILSVMIAGFCTWVVHRMGMSSIVQLIEVLTADATFRASDEPIGFSTGLPLAGLDSLEEAQHSRGRLSPGTPPPEMAASLSQRIRAGEKAGQLSTHWWNYAESTQLIDYFITHAQGERPSHPVSAPPPGLQQAMATPFALPEPRIDNSSGNHLDSRQAALDPPHTLPALAVSREAGVGARRNIRLSDNVTQFPPPSLSVTPTTHNDDAEESAYTFAHSTSERGSALVERRDDGGGAFISDSSVTEDGLEPESELTTLQPSRGTGIGGGTAGTPGARASSNISGTSNVVVNPLPSVVSPLAARRRLGDLQPILLASASASGRHNSFAADTTSLSMAATGTALTVSPPKGPTTQGSPTLMELMDSDASLDAEPDFSHLTGDSFSAARQQHLRGPSSVDPDYEFRHDGERLNEVEDQRTLQESEQEPGTDLSAYRRRANPSSERSRKL